LKQATHEPDYLFMATAMIIFCSILGNEFMSSAHPRFPSLAELSPSFVLPINKNGEPVTAPLIS
jgi:hypothetical protein